MKNELSVPEIFDLKIEFIENVFLKINLITNKDMRKLGDYRFTGNVLGKGSYSEVETVIHLKNGIEYVTNEKFFNQNDK